MNKAMNNKWSSIIGAMIVCAAVSLFGSTNTIAQVKPINERVDSKLSDQREGLESEEENISEQFLEAQGGDLARKIEAQNPDLFPSNLSDLERVRRHLFFLPDLRAARKRGDDVHAPDHSSSREKDRDFAP